MVKLKKTAGGDGASNLIPENEMVNVRVADVRENNFHYNGEDVERLRWDFTVTDPGPWQGKSIWGDTSQTFTAHPNCKAYNWATAITSAQIANGETFDTDDLIGLPARVIVGHKEDKQARIWMRVKEVLGPRPQGTQQYVQPPGPQDLGPDEAPF